MNITFLVGHLAKERHTLLYELILDISHNHRVMVFTGYPSRRISPDIREYYKKHKIEHLNDNLTIYRCGSRSGEGNNLFVRAIKYLFLTINIFFSLRKHSTDLIYIYSTPPFFGYLAKTLRKKAPIVYNAQDLFPDTLISYKKMSESNILIKLLRKLELVVYKNSRLVITISPDMVKTIKTRSINFSDPLSISYINNWVDTDTLVTIPRENNVLFDEFGFDRRDFYISYGGDIGLFQNWNLIIEIMDFLKKYKNIKFVFFGNGSYANKLKKIISERQITNCFLMPFMPQPLVPNVYSFGDLELVSLENDMTKFALPSKIGQILSVGRPILGLFDPNSQIATLINNERLGFCPYNLDVDVISQFIYNYCFGVLPKFDTIKIRDYAVEHFNRKKQTLRYEEEFLKVISGCDSCA